MSNKSDPPLAYYERLGEIKLGRGDVISTIDLSNHPGGYPVYSSSAVGSGEFGKYGRFMFDEELITWSIDGGGRPFLREKHRYSVTNVCGYLRIKRPDIWNYRYLHALFERLQSGIQFDYQMKAHPSVIRELYRFARVPIGDQQRIAQILDTLDTAIHETEALIAKLKAVKQGLLHDLLTRGIDANGELRPPQAEAPQLYKESALGWIPKEWEAKHLGEILADVDPAMRSGPFGSALLKHELVSAGIPLLGIDNVLTERFSADFRRFVTPRKFSELVRYAVHPDDLMITIMGTIGRCCLVPDGIGLALSSKHTWTISINKSVYSPYLAMLQVNYSPWVLQHFAKGQQGGTMAAIRSETLRSTVLPVPPRDEQSLIEERLREISRRIDLETDSVAKMQVEKSGLMDDLLTGRVRVTPLLNSVDPLVQPPAALIIQQAVGQMGGCDA
jgi:restriction endonuclease S subunit